MDGMFQEVAQGIPGAVIHVGQITARAKNRHKRKQGKQGHE